MRILFCSVVTWTGSVNTKLFKNAFTNLCGV